MQRITITIDTDLAEKLDTLAQKRGYQNRSETVRDLVRAGIALTEQQAPGSSHCVAGVIYVFEHGMRNLPKRLADAYQHQHDLSVATMRVALDHETCMEVAVLKGATKEVEHLAQHIVAERGVLHGRVVLIPAEIESEHHAHGHRRARTHQHIKVR
jgi:CopG family nickel-responsive transcriptional regulator